jgi:hypothetical protein
MRSERNKIPKIVHHIWTSGDEMWPVYKEYRNTWMKLNPDYKFILWTPQDFELDKYSDTSRILLQDKVFWELKFDVVTWEILNLYGGIKTDNDMICRKCFDPLLKYNSFAGKNWHQCTMGVQLVGMAQRNPLCRKISDAVNTAIIGNWKNANKGGIYKYTDYPAYPFLSQCECVLEKEEFNPFSWKRLQNKKGMPADNQEETLQKILEENDWFPNSYSIHTWGSMLGGGWTKIMKGSENA